MADMNANHNDFQGRAAPVLAVSVALIVLASIFVFFRMVSRGAIVKKIALDDYFMMIAWCIAFGLTMSVIWGTRYGLGRHQQISLQNGDQRSKSAITSSACCTIRH